MVRYWVVRATTYTDKSKFRDNVVFRNSGLVGIGWHWVGNLTLFSEKDKDRLIEKLKSDYIEKEKGRYIDKDIANKRTVTERTFKSWAGQILRFVNEIQRADIVILPTYTNPKPFKPGKPGTFEYDDDIICIGKVESESYYIENPPDKAYSDNRRDVKWLSEAKKSKLSEGLKSSLTSKSTIFNIDKHSKEIDALIKGKKFEKDFIEINGDDSIITKLPSIRERLMDISPSDFEQLITEILRIRYGKRAVKTRDVADGGIDFICTNEKGCITFRGQVKRVTRNISNSEILQLRGALLDGEKGIFVTTSVFTESAKKEAKAEGKKPIVLIDGLPLSHIILEIYDKLDEKYKKILKIDKRS